MPKSTSNERVPLSTEAGFSGRRTLWQPILDTALDAAIVMDTSGNVVDWNDRASAIFGWSREEALGRCLADLVIPPGLREAHRHGVQRFLETGKNQVLGR